MSPSPISRHVVSDRLAWVDRMLRDMRALPLDNRDAFLADRRNVWTAESCLRRALEAVLDLGRHILAKGFGLGVSEYKEIAALLAERGVLGEEDARLLRVLAGYRNRLVHFHHEITPDELYDICARDLPDVQRVADAYRAWLAAHPELMGEGT